MLAVIPARGGSKRIPGKNVVEFHGKPLIAYSIETAGKVFPRVVVSTDSFGIASIATAYGADVLMRPPELADDLTGTQAVMRHAVKALNAKGIICCVLATAPMLEAGSLRLALRELNARPELDYAFAVGTEQPSGVQDAGQFYMGRAEAFLQDRPIVGPRSAMIPVPNETVCDIDTQEDLERAREMYEELTCST